MVTVALIMYNCTGGTLTLVTLTYHCTIDGGSTIVPPVDLAGTSVLDLVAAVRLQLNFKYPQYNCTLYKFPVPGGTGLLNRY